MLTVHQRHQQIAAADMRSCAASLVLEYNGMSMVLGSVPMHPADADEGIKPERAETEVFVI